MGRKTYESIGRPLPNRINYVVSRTLNEIPGTVVFNSLENAISAAEQENIKMNRDNEIVIIGGGHIFQETSESMNKLIITRVDCDIDGDIYYPDIDLTRWDLIKTESYEKDSENDYNFKIEEYIKL
jgi:dihydrofolate reductase